MARFDGATVLITGATGGLGSAAAKAFAAEGARLVLSDLDEA
ncbi:SDR family NAD(P)-dependent oxidoreductase, partial [Mesorhizobium sp.]